MNRHLIKLNGIETHVISGAVEVINNPPMPECVSVIINFPDVVFKWMRPRSVIPKRKKEFTIRDIVEINSKACVILRDGRNLGAGGIPENHSDAILLSNELMLAREARPEATKQAEQIIAAAKLIAANAPPVANDPWKNVMVKFDANKALLGDAAKAWKEVAKIIVLGVKESPTHTTGYLTSKESATLYKKINSTKGTLAPVIEKEAACLLKKWQRKAK
jgi:hypothetical protein